MSLFDYCVTLALMSHLLHGQLQAPSLTALLTTHQKEIEEEEEDEDEDEDEPAEANGTKLAATTRLRTSRPRRDT